MSLANWYVFYSYEWYATWTDFISFDKHIVTVKVRLLKCHNRGYISSDPCYDSHFDTSGSEMRNLWSIFHIFAPLKHPFMFLMCIYFMVFDRERLLLGHLSLSLMFIEYWGEYEMFYSSCWWHTVKTFITQQFQFKNAEMQLLSLVCH